MSAFACAVADRPDLFLIVLGGHNPDRESAQQAKRRYLARVRNAASAGRNQVLIVDQALSPEQTFELMCASDLACRSRLLISGSASRSARPWPTSCGWRCPMKPARVAMCNHPGQRKRRIRLSPISSAATFGPVNCHRAAHRRVHSRESSRN